MVIKRDYYLNQLIASRLNRLIKIVTGIRRCGKSFLLFELFRSHLHSIGIDDGHIIEIALDDRANVQLRNPDNLLAFIKARITDSDQYYILLDEVQMVDDFVGVLNSLLHIRNADTYVTGSNSRFLSKDIITEFRGRGQDIHLYPLSFSEYYSAVGGDKSDRWREYYTYGGLPQILGLPDFRQKSDYLEQLVYSVFIADVIERNRIKNSFELEELFHILASAIGSPCNPNKLSDTFKSVKKVNISSRTIASYLEYLSDAFLIKKAIRYNIKGKRYINTQPKFYFTDLGLRNALLGFRQTEVTHLMENVIYNELISRGFNVDVGCVDAVITDKTGHTKRVQYEVDFVANQADSRYYIQSAFNIPDDNKMRQETESLNRINDSFKKVIVVGQNIMPYRNESGYLVMGIFDFLLNPEILRQG